MPQIRHFFAAPILEAVQHLFRFLERRGELNKSILEMRYGTFAALLQYTPVSPVNSTSKAGHLCLQISSWIPFNMKKEPPAPVH